MSMQGIVKYVLSGDTIVVKGKSNSQGTTFVSPPERTLAISEVISPKLARKDTQDEPFAFTSREITRKLLIGQEVTFTVLPTQGQASQGQTQQQQRELAKVFLNGQNLAHVLLTLGAVRLRENAKDETIEEMKLFQQTAMDEQIGIWSQESPDDKIRNIKWEVENPKVLLDQSKGKPIDGFFLFYYFIYLFIFLFIPFFFFSFLFLQFQSKFLIQQLLKESEMDLPYNYNYSLLFNRLFF